MLGENHSVHHEFPEYRDHIDNLVRNDLHFKQLVEEHDHLDKEIRGIESRGAPIDDMAFEDMKKKRIHLKDEIYQVLTRP